METKIVVIYHRADFDGIFCREIARKFLPTAEFVGWDYQDPKLPFPEDATVYILDLSPECFEPFPAFVEYVQNVIWIDHHKSAIDRWSPAISGYRIDGVSACRLAWQWFATLAKNVGDPQGVITPETAHAILPTKEQFVNHEVTEPLAVRLAGEHDVWDHRDPRAGLFQMGLRSQEITPEIWDTMLSNVTENSITVDALLNNARALQYATDQGNAITIKDSGFLVEFEGLKFLALNSPRKGSHQFDARDNDETGHVALLKFHWDGKLWDCSMYHAKFNTTIDLSAIAKKYSGGGHRGACGFRTGKLPFLP